MDWSDIYNTVLNSGELGIFNLPPINEINPSQDFNPRQEIRSLQDVIDPQQENTDVGSLQDLNPQQGMPEPEPEPKVETNHGNQLNQAVEPSSQPIRRGRRATLTASERKEHKRASDRRYRQNQRNILASWKNQQRDIEKQAQETKSENEHMLHIQPNSKQIQHLEEEITKIKSQRDVLMSAVPEDKLIMEWLACQPCNATVPAAAAEFFGKLEDKKESKIGFKDFTITQRELEGGAGARFSSKYLQDSPALLRELEGGAGISDWRRFVTKVVQSGGKGSHSTQGEGDSPPSKKAKITSSISSSDKGKGKLVVPSSTKVCVKSPPLGDICLRATDELGRNMLENPNQIATAIANVGGDLGMNTALHWVNHEGLTQARKEAVKEAASALFKMSNICDTVEREFSYHSDLFAKLKAYETKVIELQAELDARDKKSELEKSKVQLEERVEHYKESSNQSKVSLKESAVKMFKESSAFRATAADKISVFIDIGLRCAIEVAETLPAGSFLTYEALNKAMAEDKGHFLAFLGQAIRHWITHDSLPPYSKNKGILIGGPAPLITPCSSTALLQSSISATGTSASPAKVSTKTVTKGKPLNPIPSLLYAPSKDRLDSVNKVLAAIEVEILRNPMDPGAKVVDVEGDDRVRGAKEGALQAQDPHKANERDEPCEDDL